MIENYLLMRQYYLILLILIVSKVEAQYIVAGDIPFNGYYYDIPDTTIGPFNTIFIDVDGNNLDDFQIISYRGFGNGNPTRQIIVKPLNNSEVAYGHYDSCSYTGNPGKHFASLAKGINYLDTINSDNIWSNTELMVASFYYCSISEFSSDTNSINYIGVRTFNLQDTAYGYIKIRPFSTTSFTIYEIASNISFVGISSLENKLINIYPNPVKDYLIIESPIPNKIYYSITNINGQEVLNKEIYSNITKIDMSNLPIGIYLLKLIINDTLLIRKIIKE